MDEALRTAAELVTGFAVLVVVVAVLRATFAGSTGPATLAAGIRLALELLLAAGLLRLAAHPGLAALGVSAAIIVIRQVIGRGLSRSLAT